MGSGPGPCKRRSAPRADYDRRTTRALAGLSGDDSTIRPHAACDGDATLTASIDDGPVLERKSADVYVRTDTIAHTWTTFPNNNVRPPVALANDNAPVD